MTKPTPKTNKPKRAYYNEMPVETIKIIHAIVKVLSRLIKSPYKIYFLNIPYFMRVRKRLDFEKRCFFIVKKSMVLDRWVVDECLRGV